MVFATKASEIDWSTKNTITEAISIDSTLQQRITNVTQDYLKEINANSYQQNGAIVMLMDPETGKILSDVNLDAEGKVTDLNRGALETFIPGSVMKMVTASWAMYNGLNPNTKLAAGDYYMFDDGWVVNNWTRSTHAAAADKRMNLIEAIAKSNNPYFLNLYMNYYDQTGLLPKTDVNGFDADSWSDFAKSMGFGQAAFTPGIINHTGFVGDDEWSLAVNKGEYGQPRTYYPGEHAIQVMGQGDVRVTPLEMLRFYGGLANHGQINEPEILKVAIPQKFTDIPLTSVQLTVLEKGMKAAANSGNLAAIFKNTSGYRVYGKTGTGEIEGGELGKFNGWFNGFIELDNGKRVAFTILLPDVEGGSVMAAKLARQVFDEYVNVQKDEFFSSISSEIKDASAIFDVDPDFKYDTKNPGKPDPIVSVNLMPPEPQPWIAKDNEWIIHNGLREGYSHGWHGPSSGSYLTDDRFKFEGAPQEFGWGYDISWDKAFHHNIAALPGKEVVVATGTDTSYGNYVVIRNVETGIDVFYGHLEKINVSVGQEITAETTVGVAGGTGGGVEKDTQTGQPLKHIHMEIWAPVKQPDGTVIKQSVKMNWWDGAASWTPPPDTNDGDVEEGNYR